MSTRSCKTCGLCNDSNMSFDWSLLLESTDGDRRFEDRHHDIRTGKVGAKGRKGINLHVIVRRIIAPSGIAEASRPESESNEM